MTITRVVLFLALFAFWLALSGQYNPLAISMGVLSALFVTALSGEIVERSLGPRTRGFAGTPLRAWRFAVFAVWLVLRMVPAGLQVMWIVLHPRMPIDAHVMRFRTGLESPVARAILANSITLVPGTLTLEVEGDEFAVHAIVPAAGDDLVTAALQNRIAKLFLQAPETPPDVVWEPVGEVAAAPDAPASERSPK